MYFRSVAGIILLGLSVGELPAQAGNENAKRAHEQVAFGVKMAGRGLWNEALFRFKQAENAQPGNARILNNMAVAYEAVGLFDEALGHYKRALKADSSSREVKRNYSRFVEFYQAFKPDDKDSKEAETEEVEPEGADTQTPAPAESENISPGEDSG